MAGSAQAHPGGHASGAAAGLRGVVGQRTDLTIDATTVTLAYVAEVPQTRLYQEAWADMKAGGDEPTYLERRLVELPGGLTLAFDGEPLVWSPVSVTDPARVGEPGFVELHIVRTAPLPHTTGTLTFRTLNWPDEEGWFATSVRIDGALVVTSSTLARVDGNGDLADDRHGAWVKDTSLRTVEVGLRPAGLLERAQGLHPLTERMEGSNALRPPLWSLVVGGLGLIPIALAGRALGLRAARKRMAAAREEAEHDADEGDDPSGDVADAPSNAEDPTTPEAGTHEARADAHRSDDRSA